MLNFNRDQRDNFSFNWILRVIKHKINKFQWIMLRGMFHMKLIFPVLWMPMVLKYVKHKTVKSVRSQSKNINSILRKNS